MPVRASVFETLQIGVENTEGTAVPAPWMLRNSVITPTPNVPTEDVTAQGGKGHVDVIAGKEWTEATVNGVANVTDLLFWLSYIIEKPSYSTGSHTHTMTVNQNDSQTQNTYTIEMGGSNGAMKFAGAKTRSFSLEWGENTAPRYTATVMGRKMSDGITLTSPTSGEIAIYPFGPTSTNVYVATSVAGLTGSINIIKPLACTLSVGDVFNPFFTVSADESYTNTVEILNNIDFEITVEQTASLDYMTKLRAGTLLYVRIEMIGATVSGTQQKLVIDFPCRLKNPARGDNQGVYVGTYTLHANYDGSDGLATLFKVAVIENSLPAAVRTSLDAS